MIYIFTIVLNGMKFLPTQAHNIRHLKGNWRWIVVEGAVKPSSDAGHIHSFGVKWHTPDGLSVDGTTEYLDQLSREDKRIIVVRRKGKWPGKTAMCNAALKKVDGDGILLQCDVDEIWQPWQIEKLPELFEAHPDCDYARFWCRFYIGPNRMITSRYTYGNKETEWVRAWRYRKGRSFKLHAPPKLEGQNKAICQDTTAILGLVFDHYAYVFREQVAFKEAIYGYTGAVKQWENLQKQNGKKRVGDYLRWVGDNAVCETIEEIRKLQSMNENESAWKPSINVALAVCHKDVNLAVPWAKWIRALGQLQNVTLHITVTDLTKKRFPKEYRSMMQYLREAFGTVHEYGFKDPGHGHPEGPNKLFIQTMDKAAVEGFPGTVWMEVDCVPIKYDWLRICSDAYEKSLAAGKPFCGPNVQSNHMNGTGIYPHNWRELAPKILECPGSQPWDVYAGDQIVPQLHDEGVIQHKQKGRNIHFSGPGDLHIVGRRAALYHPNKNLSLIKVINKHRFGGLLGGETFKSKTRYFVCKAGNHPLLKNSGIPIAKKKRSPAGVWALIQTNNTRQLVAVTALQHQVAIKELQPKEYFKMMR